MPKYFFVFLIFLPHCLVGQQGADSPVEFNLPNHHELKLLGNFINTDYPDLAPFQYASKLYYSSFEFDEINGTLVSRVFTSLGESPSLLFDDNPKEKKLNMAYTAITITGKRVYYTLYEEDGTESVVKSEIWYKDKNYRGEWGAPKRLPRSFGLHNHLTSQPATGIIRNSRKEVLFFVSDRLGGKGKLDIWACYIQDDGSFGQPYNLPFNTSDDDISPYFDNVRQALFFSSKGHLSLGGFDILKTRIREDGIWTNPENLGRPINSFYDDIFFSLHNKRDICYFSSDRPNESCPETEPACRDFDIYQAALKATLKVFIYDQSDNSLLIGCNVELVDLKNGKVLSTYLNLDGNYASMGMDKGENYQLIVSKPGYYPIFEGFSPDGLNVFKPVVREVFLKKM